METLIKQASLEEIQIVHDVMGKAFEEYQGNLTPPSGALSETISDIIKKLSNNGGAIIAQVEGIPVGSAQYLFQDNYVYIGRVSVLPSHRGLGIGKMMVRYIETHARNEGVNESRLEVRLSIPSNVAFYKKLNYEIIEKHAYPDETDYWYVMKNSFVC
ncbi:acetyltransferase (GNAT) family protein [Paenibacillus sp. BK033]|uniref:GNAT family N-acetyltransferase n=1 Tax=Paenibacillus sp. BK033 TaxID=2512133 RepID=UPI001043FA9A|nr:GNAT family N-acetyltransferase [Paenibacillus sp. BK033]TCM87933.1 acetyltransferase (GNAT) family protein [Paenibacillus sp. BK033]